MASDDDVENSLLDEAYHDITEAWTTENGAPVLVSVDVTATRGVAGEVELEYDWSVSDWKAAEQSNFGYGFNALAIITEPSLWLVLDVGPSAKADWANVVRAVNGDDPELVTGGVNAPGGRMQVHIDLRGYGPIEDVRLNGSVPKPFVTADGKPLDIVVIHKDGFALLPPSSYDLDGVKQKFSFTGDENAHVSVTVVLLDDADKIQALLAKLATTHLPPSLQQLSESAKKRLLDSDSDAEDAEDWPAKRTRFAGQAAVAAPPVVVASQRWKDTTIDLYPGHMDKLWRNIKKFSFPSGGNNIPLKKVKFHMGKLVKALYDVHEDVEERRRQAATHIAYLLGTRPVTAPDGTTTEFFVLSETSPFLWTTAALDKVEVAARKALSGIPPCENDDGERGGKADLLGRPKKAHFNGVHLQLKDCGLEKDCGAAFAATLDPPGFIPLRNAVARFTPDGEWQLEVTMAKDVTQRFTKYLDIMWTKPYHKVRRYRRPDGTWGLETDTDKKITIRKRVKSSSVYAKCLRFYRVEHGWREGVDHDPVDFSIQVLRFFAQALLELVPSQKSAGVVYGLRDSGKSTLIELLTAAWTTELKSTSGLRASNESKTTVNYLVRYAMTTHRVVYLKEQVGINMDNFREMLAGNLVWVKNTSVGPRGNERRVTATLLVEVNKPEQVTLGSEAGLEDKVLAIPLAPLDSAAVSVGRDETERKEFFAPMAEEIFLLQMLALVSHPDAGSAFVKYWRKQLPLPDSDWRPPLLVELQKAAGAAGGAAVASLSDRVRAVMDANFEKTVSPPKDEVLMEEDYTVLDTVHKLMVDNNIVVDKTKLIAEIKAAGFTVQEFRHKVKRGDGSVYKPHVKNAVFVRWRSDDGTDAEAQPEEPAADV